MRTVIKALAALIALAAIGALVYLYGFLPRQRPAPDFQVDATPAVIERGDYLVNHVLLCNDCHSERDWTLYSGPAMPPLGAGRPCMDKDTKAVGINFGTAGFPGRLCIRNITPGRRDRHRRLDRRRDCACHPRGREPRRRGAVPDHAVVHVHRRCRMKMPRP